MQKLGSFPHDRAGFTIIQVLVAAAILGILTVALLTLLATSSKHERQLRLAKEARELSTELRASARTQACGIAALALEPVTVTDRAWSSATKYDLPQGLDGRLLKLVPGMKYGPFNIERVELAPLFDPTGGAAKYVAVDGRDADDFEHATTVRGALTVHLKSGAWNGRPLQAPVFLLLDASREKIVGCNGDLGLGGLNVNQACLNLGGQWDQIQGRCHLPSDSDVAISPEAGKFSSSPAASLNSPASPPATGSIAPGATGGTDSGLITSVRTIPDPRQGGAQQINEVPSSPQEHCDSPDGCKVLLDQMKDLMNED